MIKPKGVASKVYGYCMREYTCTKEYKKANTDANSRLHPPPLNTKL